MKNVFFLFLFVSCLACSGCRQTDVRVLIVDVPGLKTEADVQKIRPKILPLNGIIKEKLVFDTIKHQVIVTFDSMSVAHKNIEVAIAEAGYDANAIKALPTPVPSVAR